MLSIFSKKNKTAIPELKKRRFLADPEKVFYGRLRRALPKSYIFPNIDLVALMEPVSKEPKQRRAEREQLRGRRVDYAIFDARLELMCVVELTDDDGVAAKGRSNVDFLAKAGIECVRWRKSPLPTYEQILRTLAPFGAEVPPAPAPGIVINELNTAMRQDSVLGMRHFESSVLMGSGLTQTIVEELTPRGHMKHQFPQIWERICLFCTEPEHLDRYLSSLSMQDRPGKRDGFPLEVIAEVVAIQRENARYLHRPVAPVGVWDDAFINR